MYIRICVDRSVIVALSAEPPGVNELCVCVSSRQCTSWYQPAPQLPQFCQFGFICCHFRSPLSMLLDIFVTGSSVTMAVESVQVSLALIVAQSTPSVYMRRFGLNVILILGLLFQDADNWLNKTGRLRISILYLSGVAFGGPQLLGKKEKKKKKKKKQKKKKKKKTLQ